MLNLTESCFPLSRINSYFFFESDLECFLLKIGFVTSPLIRSCSSWLSILPQASSLSIASIISCSHILSPMSLYMLVNGLSAVLKSIFSNTSTRCSETFGSNDKLPKETSSLLESIYILALVSKIQWMRTTRLKFLRDWKKWPFLMISFLLSELFEKSVFI